MDDSPLGRLSLELLNQIGELAIGRGSIHIWQSLNARIIRMSPSQAVHPFAPREICDTSRPIRQQTNPFGLAQCSRALRSMFLAMCYRNTRFILHTETWALKTDMVSSLADQFGLKAMQEMDYITLMYLTDDEQIGEKMRLAYRELHQRLPVRVVAEVHFLAHEPRPSTQAHHRVIKLDSHDLGRSCEQELRRFEQNGEILDGKELDCHGTQVWPWLQVFLKAEIARGYTGGLEACDMFTEADVELLWRN